MYFLCFNNDFTYNNIIKIEDFTFLCSIARIKPSVMIAYALEYCCLLVKYSHNTIYGSGCLGKLQITSVSTSSPFF